MALCTATIVGLPTYHWFLGPKMVGTCRLLRLSGAAAKAALLDFTISGDLKSFLMRRKKAGEGGGCGGGFKVSLLLCFFVVVDDDDDDDDVVVV